MLSWLEEHQEIIWLAMAASVAIFFLSLFLIPAIIVRIRPDYFTHLKRPPRRWAHLSAPMRMVILVAKNLLGVFLFLAGMVMLGLPGQGLLTMMVGFLLLDFPGKYRLERWLVMRKAIHRPINWLRRRAGREPLIVPLK